MPWLCSILSGKKQHIITFPEFPQYEIWTRTDEYSILKGNDSVGLRIHCADRKKVYHGLAKIPSPKAILHGFLPATVRALNSYTESNDLSAGLGEGGYA